jgi:hypothetical protein
MKRIITLLSCLKPIMKKKHHKQLQIVVYALLVMVGRKTTLGLSRWSGKGGSVRTLTRFFESSLDWGTINWQIIKSHLSKKGKVYILGGDEVIVSKSGKKTYGVDRFYSSIQNQVIKSLAFLNISLIDVENRKAYPISMQQIVKESKDGCIKDKTKKQKNKKKRGVGRPKGSGNKNKKDIELTPYLEFVKSSIDNALKLINKELDIVYFVFDGAFGNNNAIQMVKRSKLEIISKLQRNSALYFPFTGEQKSRGAKKQYGDKIDYNNIGEEYKVFTEIEEDIEITIFQMEMIHKKFADRLNVVIIQKYNTKTKKISNVNLFSTDLDLSYEKIIDYYSLRFQIEFVFRDAKQEWGLEDFMNRKEKAVHNWANLSVFMVNIAHGLRKNEELKEISILDLKTRYHGMKYLDELFKLLPKINSDYLKKEIEMKVANIGAIHPVNLAA